MDDQKEVNPAIGKVDVQQLKIVCGNLDEQAAADLARRVFSDTFLDNARRGVRTTHDGDDVLFYADRLPHCLFQKPERILVERGRLERIGWILPFIQGLVPNSECWHQEETDGVKRIYCSYTHRYVIFLRSRDAGDGWNFRTAYGASIDQIRGYLQGGKRIARF